jgi:hypothetical protein
MTHNGRRQFSGASDTRLRYRSRKDTWCANGNLLRMPTPSPEELISLIYGSVAEPGAWQPTFEQCMRAIGGHSGFIFAKHRVLQTTGNIAASGIHIPNHLERYLSYFAPRNPWDHVFRHRPEGDVASVGDFAFSDSYGAPSGSMTGPNLRGTATASVVTLYGKTSSPVL